MVHLVAQAFPSKRHCWAIMVRAVACFTLTVCVSTVPAAAWAQPIAAPRDEPKEEVRPQLSKWTIHDLDPVRSIPTPEQRDADPLQYGYFLMDLSDRAEAAIRVGKHKKAIPYFEAMAKAVPNRSVSYAKLCTCYSAMSDWKNAEEQCATALEKEGVTVEDFLRYAQILLEKKADFSANDAKKLTAVIQHVREQVPNGTLADELECQLGLKLSDAGRLKECTRRLAAAAPNDSKTLTYKWSYALLRGDTAEAKRIIEHARRTAALPPMALSRMEESTRRSKFARRGPLGSSWFLVMVGVLVAGGLLACLMVVRRRQPATALANNSGAQPLL